MMLRKMTKAAHIIYSNLPDCKAGILPVRAFISIENRITNKYEYAVGVSHQSIYDEQYVFKPVE